VLYYSDNSGSKNLSSSDLKAILELSWCEKEFDSEGDESISIARPISSWLNAVVIFKFSMSVSCRISFFLVWLLVGREGLGGGEIKNSEIEDGEIGDNKIRGDEEDVEIVDCEEFFLIMQIAARFRFILRI
jgi:hypothetical protein